MVDTAGMQIIENTTERICIVSYKVKAPNNKIEGRTASIPPGCHYCPREALEVVLENEKNAFFFLDTGLDGKPMLKPVDKLRGGDTHKPTIIQFRELPQAIRPEKKKIKT